MAEHRSSKHTCAAHVARRLQSQCLSEIRSSQTAPDTGGCTNRSTPRETAAPGISCTTGFRCSAKAEPSVRDQRLRAAARRRATTGLPAACRPRRHAFGRVLPGQRHRLPEHCFVHRRQLNARAPRSPPGAVLWSERCRMFLDDVLLLLGCQLDHRGRRIRMNRREDSIANPKVRMAHVCAFDDVHQAQGDATEGVSVHAPPTLRPPRLLVAVEPTAARQRAPRGGNGWKASNESGQPFSCDSPRCPCHASRHCATA